MDVTTLPLVRVDLHNDRTLLSPDALGGVLRLHICGHAVLHAACDVLLDHVRTMVSVDSERGEGGREKNIQRERVRESEREGGRERERERERENTIRSQYQARNMITVFAQRQVCCTMYKH